LSITDEHLLREGRGGRTVELQIVGDDSGTSLFHASALERVTHDRYHLLVGAQQLATAC